MNIRIVTVPPGQEPVAMREQLVGLLLPVATAEQYQLFSQSRADDEYMVSWASVVIALSEAGKEEAADVWESTPGKMYLAFKHSCCELAA